MFFMVFGLIVNASDPPLAAVNWNDAVTPLALVMGIEQDPVPEQAPDQPLKMLLAPGAAARVMVGFPL